MGLADLQALDLNSLVGCRLTAQEAIVFLLHLDNTLNASPPNDLAEVQHENFQNLLKSNKIPLPPRTPSPKLSPNFCLIVSSFAMLTAALASH